MLKKKVILVGLALMLMTGLASTFAEKWDVSTASGWAQGEITEAYENQLMPERLMKTKLTQNITRADFAALVVQLYEGMTGEDVAPASVASFTDTNDIDVLKAKTLEIMQGDNGLASPNNLVTRQEMAVMYYRTMKKVSEKLGSPMKTSDGVLEFSDKDKVASWAIEAVDYVYENKIMTGDGEKFSPLNNAPVEQSVIVVKRLYKDNESIVVKKDGSPTVTKVAEVDISKGFKAEVDSDKMGLYLRITLTANGQIIEKKPEDDFTFSILAEDKTNGIVYVTQTHDMAMDERGVTTYKYDIAKDKMINIDEALGQKVYNVMIIKTGKYKDYVVSSIEGEKYIVYDKELKKLTEVDKGMTQENINDMIENKLNPNAVEKEVINDHKQGVDFETYGNGHIGENGELAIVFRNTGAKVVIATGDEVFAYGSYMNRADNPYVITKERMEGITNGFYCKTVSDPWLTSDDKYLFFVSQTEWFIPGNMPISALIRYDVENKDFKLISDIEFYGKRAYYKNYYGKTFISLEQNKLEERIYDVEGNWIKENYVFSTKNFVSIHNNDYANSYRYDMVREPKVTEGVYDVIGRNSTKLPDEDKQNIEYVEMLQNTSAPKMIISNRFYDGQHLNLELNNDKDIEVELSIQEQGQWGNSGVIFNVSKETYGSDAYLGYYAGVDIQRQIFIIGRSDNAWHSISEDKLPSHIEFGEKFTLKIERRGEVFKLYVNGVLVDTIRDATYTKTGRYGVRAYNAKTRVHKTVGKTILSSN